MQEGHFSRNGGESKRGDELTTAIKSSKDKKGVIHTEVEDDDGAEDKDDEGRRSRAMPSASR